MWVCSFHKIGCLFLFVGALYTNKLYGKYISNLLVHFCKYPQQYYTWCSVSRVKSNLLTAADKKRYELTKYTTWVTLTTAMEIL